MREKNVIRRTFRTGYAVGGPVEYVAGEHLLPGDVGRGNFRKESARGRHSGDWGIKMEGLALQKGDLSDLRTGGVGLGGS